MNPEDVARLLEQGNVVIQRPGREPIVLKVPEEQLDAAIARLARMFGDPMKVLPDPGPIFARNFSSISPSLQASSRPTASLGGRTPGGTLRRARRR